MIKFRKSCRNFHRKIKLTGRYLASARGIDSLRQDFESVANFCLFVGYPRSGHSLVGSLIDAHPQAMIAHELNALKLGRYGFSGRQIMHEILHNSRVFTEDGGRCYTGYSYAVPNQWQGRYEQLRLIGDKFGDFSIEALMRRPQLLEKMQRKLNIPVKFVHVIRNPYDNITTIEARKRTVDRTLEQSIDYYFSLVAGVESLKQRIATKDVFDLRLEDLVADPINRLQAMARFFELDPDENWAQASAAIVFDKPKRTRYGYDWSETDKQQVAEKIEACDFLRGYCFDD